MGAPQQPLGATQQHRPRQQRNDGPPPNATVAHHADVQMIASGPLATLFFRRWTTSGLSVANATFQLRPACRWWSTSGVLTTGAMLSGSAAYRGSCGENRIEAL